MSIRLDPRRLGALKQLAGEAGLRPGELVLRWVEERIDAERRGGIPAPPAETSPAPAGADLSGLAARIDALAGRVSELEGRSATMPATLEAAPAAEAEPVKRRRGRPRTSPVPARRGPRVALHDEITAVIEERGASTAADIAQAIAERGRYTPPRSGKGLDAATVNSRVSNPAYRERFVRQDGRIGLAERG